MEEIQARLKSRYPALSARELQVAARVKAGMPARRIAAELGIAETTVIIHRNSVYGWRTFGSCCSLSLVSRNFRSGALVAAKNGGAVVQQSKYRPQQAFEQFALRSDTRQNSNAE